MINASVMAPDEATMSLEQGIAYLSFGEFDKSLIPAVTDEWRAELQATEAAQHIPEPRRDPYPTSLVRQPKSIMISELQLGPSGAVMPARLEWEAERARRERLIFPAIKIIVESLNAGQLSAWGYEVHSGTGTSGPTGERRRLQFDAGYEARIDLSWHEGGGGIPIYCTTRRTDGPSNTRFFLHVELSTKELLSLRKSHQARELKSTGRPTPKPEIIKQFQDRIRQGVAQPRKSQEARLLNNWVKKAHPALPHVSDQTVADYEEIREYYKEQK